MEAIKLIDEGKQTEEEPKLDYWMISILRKGLKLERARLTSRYNEAYVRAKLKEKNEFNPIGQTQVILDRLNEIQVYYDEEVKKGLL